METLGDSLHINVNLIGEDWLQNVVCDRESGFLDEGLRFFEEGGRLDLGFEVLDH